MFLRRRSLPVLIIYLVIVAVLAVALWLFIPDDVKQAIYETYVNPPQ